MIKLRSMAASSKTTSNDWFCVTSYLGNEYSFKARAGQLRIQANKSNNQTLIETPAFITFTRAGISLYYNVII